MQTVQQRESECVRERERDTNSNRERERERVCVRERYIQTVTEGVC